jgi:hypothetical protein
LNGGARQRTEKIPHTVPFTPFDPESTATDAADDVLINKIVCSRSVHIPAETQTVFFISPGLIISTALTPDLSGIVLNSTVLEDAVITTGYVPVTITLEMSNSIFIFPIDLPFQKLIPCPGARPRDTLTAAPAEIDIIIIQQVPMVTTQGQLIFSLLFKVILRTKITVTRPMIGKLGQKSTSCLKDVCRHRPEAEPRTVQFSLTGAENATLTTESDIENQ